MFLCSTMTGPGPCSVLPWLGTLVPEGIFMSVINSISYKSVFCQNSVNSLMLCLKLNRINPSTTMQAPHSCCAWHQSPLSMMNSIKVCARLPNSCERKLHVRVLKDHITPSIRFKQRSRIVGSAKNMFGLTKERRPSVKRWINSSEENRLLSKRQKGRSRLSA